MRLVILLQSLLITTAIAGCAARPVEAQRSVELETLVLDCGSRQRSGPSSMGITAVEWLNDGRLRVRSLEHVRPYEVVSPGSGTMRVGGNTLTLSYLTKSTGRPYPRMDGAPVPIDMCPSVVRVTFLVSGLPRGQYNTEVVSYPLDDEG